MEGRLPEHMAAAGLEAAGVDGAALLYGGLTEQFLCGECGVAARPVRSKPRSWNLVTLPPPRVCRLRNPMRHL